VSRFFALFLLPLAALAQSSIQGVVLDPSGAAVPEASVTAVLGATGAVRTVRTAADGRYRIPALNVGTYTIRFEKDGFQKTEIPQVYLGLNQTVEKLIQLKLATAGTSIDVSEHPEALDTTSPTAGVGLGGETLEETPSQNRSYLGVVLLAPGVAPAAGSNALRTKAGMRWYGSLPRQCPVQGGDGRPLGRQRPASTVKSRAYRRLPRTTMTREFRITIAAGSPVTLAVRKGVTWWAMP
jgi:hypothetical protein